MTGLYCVLEYFTCCCFFFTRDSIYAIARICYRPSVCPSVCPSFVCYTDGSVKNGWSL